MHPPSVLATSYSQRNLAGFLDNLAPLRSVFADESVNEIMINGPHDVWIRQRGPDKKLNVELPARSIAAAITLLASMAEKQVNKSQLLLSARLPGFRVEAMLPPVAVKGPSMCIRRHATKIVTLDDYIASKTITRAAADYIEKMVADRRNFLIAGGTYSGKTTLMNCVLSLIDPEHRLFVIEQVQELKIVAPNHVLTECDPEQGVTAKRAVMLAMRYSPGRIFLGELRGAEAYDWMDAANTGHPGSGATIHSDSAADALRRLEKLVMSADSGVPYQAVQEDIGDTVHVVLYIQQRHGERRLSQICEIQGFDRESVKYRINSLNFGE